jgi:hypothetical protein
MLVPLQGGAEKGRAGAAAAGEEPEECVAAAAATMTVGLEKMSAMAGEYV